MELLEPSYLDVRGAYVGVFMELRRLALDTVTTGTKEKAFASFGTCLAWEPFGVVFGMGSFCTRDVFFGT